VKGLSLLTNGAPISAGWKRSADRRVHTKEIISSFPMLAVPGWLDAKRLPKPVAVASALKNTPRARLDVKRCELPARQDITK
jgi:hypothetical protein